MAVESELLDLDVNHQEALEAQMNSALAEEGRTRDITDADSDRAYA